MPRGIPTYILPAEKVREGIGYTNQQAVADAFGVTARTVRRWLTRGMAYYYRQNPGRDEWEAFAATRNEFHKRIAWLTAKRLERASVDQHLSESSSKGTGYGRTIEADKLPTAVRNLSGKPTWPAKKLSARAKAPKRKK